MRYPVYKVVKGEVFTLWPDGQITARPTTELERRAQAEQAAVTRTIRPEALTFAEDLSANIGRVRFWVGVIVLAALVIGVVAVGALFQIGHAAHLFTPPGDRR